MEAGRKEGEVEIEVFWVEHPFVVLESGQQRLEPIDAGKLTRDIEREKRYHSPISRPLIKLFFTTL